MQILRHKYQPNNVGRVERAASIMAGTLLFTQGIRTRGWFGTGAALLGIAFLRRGITGFCYTFQVLGISSAAPRPQHGAWVDEAITINLPREDVYRFWRDIANLASVLDHVESARACGENRSHWIVKMPDGRKVEWSAELVQEKENELIEWRGVDDSALSAVGSVHFQDAAGGRGTEVRLLLRDTLPIFGDISPEDAASLIRHNLKRLKARLEAGVLPETEGQPVGARKPAEEERHQPDVVTKASEESFPASDAPAYLH